jgi:hypothetical protein
MLSHAVVLSERINALLVGDWWTKWRQTVLSLVLCAEVRYACEAKSRLSQRLMFTDLESRIRLQLWFTNTKLIYPPTSIDLCSDCCIDLVLYSLVT